MMKHYIILLGGLGGTNFDLLSISKQINVNHNFTIISPDCNNLHKSYDGIEKNAKRAYDYVSKNIPIQTEKPIISIIGQSMGGIVGRYLAYIMYQEEKYEFDTFISIVSPHLGAFELKSKLSPILPYYPFLCQSAKELLLEDDEKILFKMTNPIFIDSLNSFKKRILYSNVRNDIHVPYLSASISGSNKNEKNEKDMILENIDADYARDIQFIPDEKLINDMKKNLNTINWIRYDLISNYLFLAHYVITPLSHDNKVIQHIQSHFKPHP